MALDPLTSVLIRRGDLDTDRMACEDKDTGRRPCKDGGRELNDAATSQAKPRIASHHQKQERGGPSPRAFGGSTALDSRLMASATERIRFCSFKLPSLW